jgi:hypothetical protein
MHIKTKKHKTKKETKKEEKKIGKNKRCVTL